MGLIVPDAISEIKNSFDFSNKKVIYGGVPNVIIVGEVLHIKIPLILMS